MWGEAWLRTTGDSPLGETGFPATWDLRHHPPPVTLTQWPVCHAHPQPSSPSDSLSDSDWEADPSQTLSGKFQTSPVIPQKVYYKLSVQNHWAQCERIGWKSRQALA